MSATNEDQTRHFVSGGDKIRAGIHRFAWAALRALLGVNDEPVLNASRRSQPIDQPDRALLQTARKLKAAAVKPEGQRVDYRALAESQAYRQLRALTGALSQCRLETLGDHHHRLAFWINLYNTLILDAVISYRLEGRLGLSLYQRASYDVGGHRFSADDIEHGVLRGNRPHPAFQLRAFGPDDPRRSTNLEPLDPRIHFALNCGARSCPPIAFFDGLRIDSQLDAAAASFIAGGGARVEPTTGTLWLSKILGWYEGDFGGRKGVLALVADHMAEQEMAALVRSGELTVRYQPYDWTVNRIL